MNTTKVKVLLDFTMGNATLRKDAEISVEDWRAVRLRDEGLVEILPDKPGDTPVEETPKFKKTEAPSSKKTILSKIKRRSK